MSKDKKYELDQLITKESIIEMVDKGLKTAVRRNNRYGNIGDTFILAGKEYEIIQVYEQQLGDMTDEDAKKEGFDSLEKYKESITSIHKAAVWVPKLTVWVHEFTLK